MPAGLERKVLHLIVACLFSVFVIWLSHNVSIHLYFCDCWTVAKLVFRLFGRIAKVGNTGEDCLVTVSSMDYQMTQHGDPSFYGHKFEKLGLWY